MDNTTAFLECCPVNERLSRGIRHLSISIQESSIELKLIAACSAMEYFYSYWFWDMGGIEKLIEEGERKNPLLPLKNHAIRGLKKIKSSKDGRTPFLSTVIRFFIDDLGIDGESYFGSEKILIL